MKLSVAWIGKTKEPAILSLTNEYLKRLSHYADTQGMELKAESDLLKLGERGARPVWRIVCPPASGGKLGERLARDTGAEVIYDWGGGLIWAALPAAGDAQAPLVRSRVDAAGGHAMLLRASEEVRRKVDVFHPANSGVAALSERVRLSFDPKGILNRGRMVRGLVA